MSDYCECSSESDDDETTSPGSTIRPPRFFTRTSLGAGIFKSSDALSKPGSRNTTEDASAALDPFAWKSDSRPIQATRCAAERPRQLDVAYLKAAAQSFYDITESLQDSPVHDAEVTVHADAYEEHMNKVASLTELSEADKSAIDIVIDMETDQTWLNNQFRSRADSQFTNRLPGEAGNEDRGEDIVYKEAAEFLSSFMQTLDDSCNQNAKTGNSEPQSLHIVNEPTLEELLDDDGSSLEAVYGMEIDELFEEALSIACAAGSSVGQRAMPDRSPSARGDSGQVLQCESGGETAPAATSGSADGHVQTDGPQECASPIQCESGEVTAPASTGGPAGGQALTDGLQQRASPMQCKSGEVTAPTSTSSSTSGHVQTEGPSQEHDSPSLHRYEKPNRRTLWFKKYRFQRK